jgi:L-ascorbate metabolism protein UlaG (beta-lactamase superfamily)
MPLAAENRKERILQSPNFRNGSFQNLSETPMKPADVSYFRILKDSLKRPADSKPGRTLPSIKTDLKALHSEKPVIVWFGHSSYLIQINGMNILVDPVFSGHASPFSFMVKAFPGSDAYTPDDFPPIDILIITHNHYDHLDKTTIKRLIPKIRSCYTALGAGAHLEEYGLTTQPLVELDWWDTVEISLAIRLTATPARHFSGRGLKRGGTLWASFVLQIAGCTLYIGGDSGYDTHFRKIGDQFGPFDLAILECGQYNAYWPYIHMMPEQTVQAALDLGAKMLLPVHWGKFALSLHSWNEPIKRVTRSAAERNLPVTTPLIGERVVIGESYQKSPWWNF